MKIRIGSRGSKLALIQANMVKNSLLSNNCDLDIEIILVDTAGDRNKSANLRDIGGKALFLKELQEALIEREIDVAVHSMKDVPAINPESTVIAAVLERGDHRDVFLSRDGSTLSNLKKGSTIGTSSPRRAAQVLKLRPDVQIVPFRGNVDSRIKKMQSGEVDGTLLALAGIQRLEIDADYQILDPIDVMIPAVGQGAICVECLKVNSDMRLLISGVNHAPTFTTIQAERGFLETINGTCDTPLGAYAKIVAKNLIKMRCFLANDNNINQCQIIDVEGALHEAYSIGAEAALRIKKML